MHTFHKGGKHIKGVSPYLLLKIIMGKNCIEGNQRVSWFLGCTRSNPLLHVMQRDAVEEVHAWQKSYRIQNMTHSLQVILLQYVYHISSKMEYRLSLKNKMFFFVKETINLH